MTPPLGASAIRTERDALEHVVETLATRAAAHADLPPAEAEVLRQRVRERAQDLLTEWGRIATELHNVGAPLQYQSETGQAPRLLYAFLDPELKHKHPRYQKFRANRSMRDVEPSVNLWLKTSDGADLEEPSPTTNH